MKGDPFDGQRAMASQRAQLWPRRREAPATAAINSTRMIHRLSEKNGWRSKSLQWKTRPSTPVAMYRQPIANTGTGRLLLSAKFMGSANQEIFRPATCARWDRAARPCDALRTGRGPASANRCSATGFNSFAPASRARAGRERLRINELASGNTIQRRYTAAMELRVRHSGMRNAAPLSHLRSGGKTGGLRGEQGAPRHARAAGKQAQQAGAQTDRRRERRNGSHQAGKGSG